MKRMINMGSIEQFRTIVKNVQRTAQFVSYNEETKEVITNKEAKMPVITVIGTEKIHGTNAAVCYSNPDGFWVQSRKNIITPEKDNAGCAFQAMANKEQWMGIINALAKEYNIDLNENIISVYFEWSGGNIQKNSALTGLDKKAIIFQYFKVSPINPQTSNNGGEVGSVWKETKTNIYRKEIGEIWECATHYNIYNIMNFPHISLDIDFDRPDIAQNKMIELAEEIQYNSPVGNAFGIEKNIGEGYVFSGLDTKGNLIRWKVKTEAHSKGTGKVKTLKPVDEELENKKRKFVNEYAATEGRMDQMYTEIVHSKYNGEASLMTMKDMGDYLSLIHRDVIKEEMDRMSEMGLEPKMVNSLISKVAREYFRDRLDTEVGI